MPMSVGLMVYSPPEAHRPVYFASVEVALPLAIGASSLIKAAIRTSKLSVVPNWSIAYCDFIFSLSLRHAARFAESSAPPALRYTSPASTPIIIKTIKTSTRVNALLLRIFFICKFASVPLSRIQLFASVMTPLPCRTLGVCHYFVC